MKDLSADVAFLWREDVQDLFRKPELEAPLPNAGYETVAVPRVGRVCLQILAFWFRYFVDFANNCWQIHG